MQGYLLFIKQRSIFMPEASRESNKLDDVFKQELHDSKSHVCFWPQPQLLFYVVKALCFCFGV